MKFIKFVLVFSFALICQLGNSQNFVTSKIALEKIELKQAERENLYQQGSLSIMQMELTKYFFEIMVIYIKDGSDVAESINVALEKCLNTFEKDQEEVVIFKDDVITLLTEN